MKGPPEEDRRMKGRKGTMNKKTPVIKEKIFEPDEGCLIPLNRNWTPEEVLGQRGILFLKDVVKILNLDPLKVKREVRKLLARDQSPWEVMGVKKVWNHWLLRMTVFAPYYRKNLESRVRSIDKNWDSNVLLEQKGIFYLTEVCTLIPFSTHQLRYQAKQNPRSREEYGIWKEEELNSFVVDMERFALWIKKLWAGDYRK